MSTATIARPAQPAGSSALPDPGERPPTLSWPIVGIFCGALMLFAISSWAAIGGYAPRLATIGLSAVAIFVMFTVLHDASHYSISTHRWVNRLFGRASMLFVSTLLAFEAFGFIHIEHHRHTNDDERDPDHFASHGPAWLLPVRFALNDVTYMSFYLRNIGRRPRRELAESAALFLLSVAVLAATIVTGRLWILLVVYVIPQRIATAVLAWWFDWLPHHGLDQTQTENRYRATRNRVGLEWLFTPVMLSQNYHLVHHLHPSVPFHRYVRTWRHNEAAYLERDVAIATAFGKPLEAAQYHDWKQLNHGLLKVLPVRMPPRPSIKQTVFHPLPVAAVEALTDDSTLVTFEVPAELADEFRFEPGQHVTVKTDHGGEGVRRNYSICASANGATLQIAVKHIEGGAFSTFVADRLAAGDVLDVMTPTGRFCPPLNPLHRKHYAAIVAGSGITPVMSMLETILEVEPESAFTLIYGNRTKDSTMFRPELDELESRYPDRLEILHVLSRDPLRTRELRGRIDRDKLEGWLAGPLSPDHVDEWLLCGPAQLAGSAHETLIDHGVEPERIHLELFHGYDTDAVRPRDSQPATLAFTLDGRHETVELHAGESILEAALRARSNVPYACMGGACGTCRARLTHGTAEMEHNYALDRRELEAGFVLTCQARPTSESVAVDYDQ